MLLVLLIVVVATAYLVVNIGLVILRNHKSHSFFQTKSPRIPVVPNANIICGHVLSIMAPRKNWKIIEDLHEKYGPTFGHYYFNEPVISTKDVDLIKAVFLDEGHKHSDRSFLGVPYREFNHSIFQINGEQWRQVRRVMTPALTNHKIKSDEVSSDLESVVLKLHAAMERRIARSSDPASFEIDAKDLFMRYSLSVTFLVTYKQSDIIDFDCEEDRWTKQIDRAARDLSNPVVYISMTFPFLRPLCEFLIRFHNTGRMAQTINRYIEQATDINRIAREQWMKSRSKQADGLKKVANFTDIKAQGNYKRRMVDNIIDGYLEKKISYDHFLGSLLALLMAGGISVSDTTTNLMWELAKNPDLQERLRKIILEEGIETAFVDWCINETMRCHPAVPLAVDRKLTSDVTVNGLTIPEGSHVLATVHGIHYDPNIWPEPERFNPDRWQDEANFHPAAFLGFGLGPRNCIGGKLAMEEIRLALKMVLANYRIETCAGTPDKLHFSSPTLLQAINDAPIMLRFTRLEL